MKKKKIIKIVITCGIIAIIGWLLIIKPFAQFNNNEKKLEEGAKRYFEINPRALPKEGEITTISYSTLATGKYVEDLYIPYSNKVCSVDESWIKVKKEGGDYKYFINLKCGYLSSLIDKKGPDIKLNGNEVININVGGKYKELGVKSVYDDTDKNMKISDVKINSNSVDTNTIGTYEVTYTAYDALDNKTTIIRKVNVVKKLAPIVNKFTNETTDRYVKVAGIVYKILGLDKNGNIKIVANEDISSINYDGIDKWLEEYYDKIPNSSKKYLTKTIVCEEKITNETQISDECKKPTSKNIAILSTSDIAKNVELFSSGTIIWLSNGKDSKKAWTNRVWYAGTPSKYMDFEKEYAFGIKPVLTLKKSTLIASGDGSLYNPYTIGDIKKPKNGSKISSRYIGEYITYGGYIFRIVDTLDDNTTRVISEDMLHLGYDYINISYSKDKDVLVYNPSEKGNIGYQIENETPKYIKDDIFVKHNIDVKTYKNYISYGKEKETKKYNVKFAAPSVSDYFATVQSPIAKDYWLRDSSAQANIKFINAAAGNIYYTEKYARATAAVKIVAHINKNASIVEGKGTEMEPYVIVR